ncbi:MAG: MBL fold metallo-hydrolase [Candidatus Hermodarchaeota archaeon]
MDQKSLRLIFIGSSGGIQVPSFHCSCQTCNNARLNLNLRRTRASILISGKENTLIDAGPDIEFQLEREGIRNIDRIFLTHWHYDHCFGLAAFPELATHGLAQKDKIDLYLPLQDMRYLNTGDFAWAKSCYKLLPIIPGNIIKLPDITLEVVKTNHTEESVGYIVSTFNKKFAYLVDSVVPPKATINRLIESDLDFIILEGTVDELELPNDQTIEDFKNFSIVDAVEFWKTLSIPKCILTHASFHSWKINKLVEGISSKEREIFVKKNMGLSFAYDGLTLNI